MNIAVSIGLSAQNTIKSNAMSVIPMIWRVSVRLVI